VALRITLDIFSGRPNPVIEVEGPQAGEILRRLRPGPRLTGREASEPELILGYRGLVIEQIGAASDSFPRQFRYLHGHLFGPRFSRRAEDERFEDFISGDAGLLRGLSLGATFPDLFRKEVARSKKARAEHKEKEHHKRHHHHHCECGPLYEPAWWNVPQRQPFNNCYNYATNYRTDTFAQPGLAAGSMYTALNCSSVGPAAVKDDLISTPGANNKCPKEGHLVALVIWPGVDFHWFRKGRNGFWSHKPGGTPVRNVDNSNHLIPDPRTANRGPYTTFCTFMVVMHGHIKIR
jgi:hypothetical protein